MDVSEDYAEMVLSNALEFLKKQKGIPKKYKELWAG
jgi:hypothetical protein